MRMDYQNDVIQITGKEEIEFIVLDSQKMDYKELLMMLKK
jgi:hypothetical protein